MKYNETKGVSISELSLGTVQLGVSYGINNQSGKPDRTQAFGILDTALTNGISALDTAAAYGDSEQVIGQWLQTIPEEKRRQSVCGGCFCDFAKGELAPYHQIRGREAQL